MLTDTITGNQESRKVDKKKNDIGVDAHVQCRGRGMWKQTGSCAAGEYVIEDASEQTTEFYLPKEETDKLEEQYREVLTQIKTAVADRNMEELAQYVAYPCYVGIPDVIAVRSEEEFETLDVDQVLTEELVDVIENTDIDSLELYDAGYVVSGESGKPNITIGTGEDGKVGITGFNY